MSFRVDNPEFLISTWHLRGNAEDSVRNYHCEWSNGGDDEAYAENGWGHTAGLFDFTYVESPVKDKFNGLFFNGGSFSIFCQPFSAGYYNVGTFVYKESEFMFWIQYTSGNKFKVKFIHDFSGDSGIWTTTDFILRRNEGTHVVVTYDSASIYNDPNISINAENVAVTEGSDPTGTKSIAETPLRIGYNGDSGYKAFDGLLWTVQPYNCILTQDEIIKIREKYMR